MDEQSYSGVGIPTIVTGGCAMVFGIAALTLGWGQREFTMFGMVCIAFGAFYLCSTPTHFHVRSDEIGFTLLTGKTEWVPKEMLTARIVRRHFAPYGLRFDVRGKHRLVPLIFDTTMMTTASGGTIEPRDIEAILGMPVTATKRL